jgi:hypothetical protein
VGFFSISQAAEKSDAGVVSSGRAQEMSARFGFAIGKQIGQDSIIGKPV